MNWIKKLLQYIHADDDDPIEMKPTQIRQNKHVEARVTYQYPKGNFRFPLIPDNESTKVEKVQVNRTRTPQTKKQSTPKPVYKAQDKQPFRPTETPSPVHGLTKPVLSKDIVEFELPSSPIEDTELIAKAWKEAHDEVASTNLVTDTVEIGNRIESSFSVVEQEKVMNFADELMKEQEESEVTVEVVKAEMPMTEAENKMVSTFTSVDDSQMSHVRISSYEGDKAQTHSEPETLEEIVRPEMNMPTLETSDVKAEEHIEPQVVEQEQVHVEPDITEQSSYETNTEETEQEKEYTTPRRSHIPFNVLMFKKDKQKMSQKDSEQKQMDPIQINETPEQQDNTDTDTEMKVGYSFPELSFLLSPPAEQYDDSEWLMEQRDILDLTLRNFKVGAKVVNVTQGPAVTRFEVHPEPGVKVNKITNLSDDIKLSMAAKDIRMEAPIPGKNTIGIEVPNKKSKPVLLKEILQSPEFITNKSPLTVAMGLDISGKPIITDLQKMPHGLIAGATGSGKSVCINAMLVSLLYKASPDEVKLLLIDPKMVELAPYNHIPHLVSPVITDVKAATASLKWAVEEMERRYELFAHSGVRDIGRYNEMVKRHDEKSGKLPYLVIIIDELADLMMVAPGDVEDSIIRIAQKARACGIHLLLATQRPSVDVITGLIKANIPTRIAFSVSSQIDSRTIIDSSGAEKLLGKGDMLFLENGSSKPFRVQGNFVSDDEIEQVVEFVKSEMKPTYMFEQDELLKKNAVSNDEDELFLEACEFVLEHGGASTSSVQRRFRIGYNRAARLIDMMEDQGIISESRGSKPREVLITEEELATIYEG